MIVRAERGGRFRWAMVWRRSAIGPFNPRTPGYAGGRGKHASVRRGRRSKGASGREEGFSVFGEGKTERGGAEERGGPRRGSEPEN